MTEPPAAPTGRKSTAWITLLVVFLFVSVGGWLAYRYFWSTPAKPTQSGDASNVQANINNDPLCESMQSKQLVCVAELGSDSLLGPGHFVKYPLDAKPAPRVSFSDGDIFRKGCVVPGEEVNELLASLDAQETKNTVVLEELTYKLSRSYAVGGELPIPRLNGLVLKAGPKLSEDQDIHMSAESAWLKMIDVNAMLDVLRHAGINQNCLRGLATGEYSVISRALIGKQINIEVKDKQGKNIGISAAAKAGSLEVSAGTSASADVEQEIKTRTGIPVVLGVSFFSPSVFLEQPAITQPIAYKPSAELSLTVSGNGGLGALSQRTQSTKIGQPLAINVQGTEASECNQDFERRFSSAWLNASVLSPDEQTLEVALNGALSGGHYATGTCVGNNIIGKVGHDNGASLVGNFNGDIRTIVRSDDARELTVRTASLPPEVRIEVKDPQGVLIAGSTRESQANGEDVSHFPLHGAGIYSVSAKGTVPGSVNGASSYPVNYRFTVKVEAH